PRLFTSRSLVISVHQFASEPPPGHKPAPELTPDHKPAPELPPGHKPAPEPVGEAAPMPPEVTAVAVEPPMEAAFPYNVSASLRTLCASSVPAFLRSQTRTQVPVPPRRAAPPPASPRRAAAPPAPPPVPPWRAAAPSPPILSASSVPAFPRSQTVTRIPAPPRRAAAPPAPPCWVLPAPPWRSSLMIWWSSAPPIWPTPPWPLVLLQSPVYLPSHGPGPPSLPQFCLSSSPLLDLNSCLERLEATPWRGGLCHDPGLRFLYLCLRTYFVVVLLFTVSLPLFSCRHGCSLNQTHSLICYPGYQLDHYLCPVYK
ncbi:hypothetical protein M9458_048605, partial [Cirrhinus mrigala]